MLAHNAVVALTDAFPGRSNGYRVSGLDAVVRMDGRSRRRIAILLVVLLPPGVYAAPNEIKIFTDELAKYGEHTLETHVNKASRAGPRAGNPIAPLQVMPEYSYGIWRNWEFSLQLPVAQNQDRVRSEGYRVELQYVAPHEEAQGFYWGLNIELARTARLGEPQVGNLEIIPILGLRVDRWHIVANPGIKRAVTGPERSTNFEPAAKIAYRVLGMNYFGCEYYWEAGPLRHWLPRDRQSRVLYFAWDGKIGKSDINFGIGRGLSEASDRWVFKVIYEFSF